MKVLFVVKSKKMENLGVMYLSAVVKKAGHEAKIVALDNAVSTAKSWLPDMIGFSVMTGDQHKMIVTAAEIKKTKKKPVILFGGPHPTFFPQDFEKYDFINIIAKGEWEQQLSELLESPIRYPNIDSLPWPDRTNFPNMPIRDFITSRGCPFDCSYCYNQKWAEMFPDVQRVRTRSVGNVIEEILYVAPEFVYFQDSCFGLNKKWLREFSKRYSQFVRIPFHCHLRPNQVDEEKIILLSDAKCYSVRIALESASIKLRKLLNRKMTNSDVYTAVRLLKKWDIKCMVQNIIGLPTATIEDDMETLEMNIRMHPTYAWVSIFAPYPGTELGDRCKKEGQYKGDYSDMSDSFFDTSVLEIPDTYRVQLECLQKVFALCVEVGYMPEVKELHHGNFPKLVHKIMRQMGDKKLYGGVI